MSGEDSNEDLSIKNNFLTVLHTLKFSNESENVNEACHVERRCLAARYMAAKRFNDEDTANFLLKKGLENYQRLMDDTTGANNHLSHVETLIGNKVVNNADWKSGLKDTKAALQFVKPLACRNDNLKACLKKEFDDRHIRDIVEAWKREDSSSRPRKISVKHPSSSNHETIKGNLDSPPVSKQPSLSNYGAKTSKHQERSTTNDVEYQKLISMLPKEFDRREPMPDTRCPGRSQLSLHHSESSSIIHNKGNSKLFSRDSDIARSFEKDENNSQHHEISHFFKRTSTNQSHLEAVNETRHQKSNCQTFRTATEEFRVQQQSKNQQLPQKRNTGTLLGGKRTVNRPFICPLKRSDNDEENTSTEEGNSEDSRLKNIDAKMVELIKSEIMDSGAPVSWDDIAGLEFAKNTIKEIVVLPLLRPDIFTGLRRPPKGILLFGPPGTGKTLIGKCIASQSKSTFFSISASSLASKWIGEGEKLVRALFAVARVYQPAVVFIDEIDSLLSKRSDNEHDSTRKVKTEFLVQLDGAATAEDDRILIVGATNRPHELDEAARRRLVKRLYVPLPEIGARKQIISNLLRSERHNVSLSEVDHIAELTDGYSGADMTNLCKEASMGPIRSIPLNEFENINQGDVREVTVDDFLQALSYVRASVSKADLSVYVEWDSTYGTGTAQKYNS